jgi:hypothetical protein
LTFLIIPEHSFRGDILRISPWSFNYLNIDFFNYLFPNIYFFDELFVIFCVYSFLGVNCGGDPRGPPAGPLEG